MRCISKTNIIRDNSGETMVEVLVAFTLLSIMLLMFTQGITWAAKSEAYAYEARRGADQAMLDVQTQIAGGYKDADFRTLTGYFDDRVKCEEIISGNYTYVFYESTLIETGP